MPTRPSRPDLTSDSTLAIDASTHAHTADNADLSTASVLTVSDSTHAHTSDNLGWTTPRRSRSTRHRTLTRRTR